MNLLGLIKDDREDFIVKNVANSVAAQTVANDLSASGYKVTVNAPASGNGQYVVVGELNKLIVARELAGKTLSNLGTDVMKIARDIKAEAKKMWADAHTLEGKKSQEDVLNKDNKDES